MIFLLRSIGIPARYATGYLVHEYNRFTGYYVVRERDSHAWVEAYVEGKGWVTFDPTPGGGEFEDLMGPKNPGFSAQLIDFLMFKLEKFKDLFIRGDYKAFVKLIWREIVDGFNWLLRHPLIPLVFLIIVLAIVFRRKLLSFMKIVKDKEKEEIIKSPEIRKLHYILEQFEENLKKKGVERKENLTLYEYGRHLKEENKEKEYLNTEQLDLYLSFIDDYCKLRYASLEIGEGDLDLLEKKLRQFEKIK